MTKKYLNEVTYRILRCAIEVHKMLGPGLLESVYHKCLMMEFQLQGITFVSELQIPVEYKGFKIEASYRVDFLVVENIVVELKAADSLHPVHNAQLLTYMKLLRKPKGILINFNSRNIIHEGSRQLVNEYFRLLPDN